MRARWPDRKDASSSGGSRAAGLIGARSTYVSRVDAASHGYGAFEPAGGWGATAADVVRRWSALAEPLDVPGARTAVWRAGKGEPVVLLHGVPASSFLYRKVIPRVARHGLEAVAIDLPGLGLAERTRTLDLSWTSLSAWVLRAIDALGIDRYHLVVHDIAGPIGVDVIRRAPERARSLLVLNTPLRVASFRPPPVMRPFTLRGIGRAYVASLTPWTTERLMHLQGVLTDVPSPELRAYSTLLKREDGGETFLRLMRSFELTEALERRIVETLAARRFPARVLWGERDPALRIERWGEIAREVVGVPRIERVRARHFVQEDAPGAIADAIAELARESTRSTWRRGPLGEDQNA